MKKIILLSAFVIFTLTCKSQTNTIGANDLTVNGIEVYGLEKALLLEKFGNPLSITQEFFEMDDLYAQKYYYNGMYFYLVNDKVEIFCISNSNYVFSGYSIKIGDPISGLQPYFPISYLNRKGNSIVLSLDDMDASVLIEYNMVEVITLIKLSIH